jgi:hypothetical protein
MGIVIPSDFTFPEDYHMTIKRGEVGLGSKLSGFLGSKVELKVKTIGISNEAIAVGVEGLYSTNETQHITIAFKNSPYESNDITNWISLEKPFKTYGFIREAKRKEGFGRIKNKDI